MIKKLTKIIGILVIVTITGFFSFKAGILVGEENILKLPPSVVINPIDVVEGDKVDFSVFWEAWRKLENKYVDKEEIDYEKMFYGAIDGMVSSLGDPYTSFFTPPEAESFNEEMGGKYEGVGMVIGIRESQLIVVSPFKDSPADLAGLKAGDIVLKIDDFTSADLTVEESANKIKGERGTIVKLLIEREGWDVPKEFSIKRESITIPTLDWEKVGDGDIALIKIYQFNRIVDSEFEKAALEILNSPVKKIIIDLRNNPGGYLDQAQALAGWFIPKGEIITWEDRGEGEGNRKAYNSAGPAMFAEYPTVVLINEGSASGSEIMAGAMRDQRGIKLVGTKSFGKGSVQEQLTLSDESFLKVTVAKWLTPNGNNIHQEGLVPDIEVEMTESEEEDVQLDAAVEFLQGL